MSFCRSPVDRKSGGGGADPDGAQGAAGGNSEYDIVMVPRVQSVDGDILV